jgi:hypothetical protein
VSATLDRAHERRMEHLAIANETRFQRAALKRAVASGEVTAGEVLADPPPHAHGMRVYDLLLAQPRWGEVKTLKLLRVHGVSPAKQLGGLTVRQRVGLGAALEPAAVAGHGYRAPASHRCTGCGLYMREPTVEMLCGFCEDERAA